jgi:predicted DNA-binding protein
MTTITLDETLTTHFQVIANQRHTSVEQIVNQALQAYLEDYLDIVAAEQVLAAIERGEEKVLSLEEAEKLFNELAH